MSKTILFISLMIILLPRLIFADHMPLIEELKNLLIKEKDNQGFGVLPGIFYTPETKLGGVIGTLYYVNPKETSRKKHPTNISAGIIYTLNNQAEITIIPNIYFKNYIFGGNFKYVNYPQEFFGIGNNTPDKSEIYNENSVLFEVYLQKKILSDFFIGPIYTTEENKTENIKPNGILENLHISGVGGMVYSGIGLVLSYDSRNNIFFTTTGAFIKSSLIFYNSSFESSRDFTRFIADIRYFFKLLNSQYIGLQCYLNFNDNELPFQLMPYLGGSFFMRGIEQTRYMDKNMLLFQVEHKMVLSNRLHLITFGAIGDVSNKIEKFYIPDFKTIIGLGFRYQLSQQGINLRLDFAFRDNNIKVYFTALEAF